MYVCDVYTICMQCPEKPEDDTRVMDWEFQSVVSHFVGAVN